MNPFNDLNENGKEGSSHKGTEDLAPEAPKIVSNGVGNAVSNGLANSSDREGAAEQ